jgi:tripartite-type tricarboxylate transporter receptor subunit TctC
MQPYPYLRTGIGALVLAGFCSLSCAQSYPSRPVKVLIGTPAGSGIDVGLRVIAARIQPLLGQALVVEPRPGADGMIAARQAASATPDGYTVVAASNGHMAITPVLQIGVSYDPLTDFEAVAMLARFSSVLVVNAGIPVRDVADFVRYAKSRPGDLNYGSSSANYMLAMELFKALTGTSMRHVPYQGNPQVGAALISGDVQAAIVSIGSVTGFVQGGKLRPLAIAGSSRDATLPDVPTLAEAGIRGYDVDVWVGLFAPAGIPAQAVAQLSAAFRGTLDLPEVRDQLNRAGIAASWGSGTALRETVVRDLKTYRDLVARLAAISK